MFGIFHNVRRKNVEGDKICYFSLLCSRIYGLNNIRIDNILTWSKIMLNFLFSIYKFHNIFSKLRIVYYNWSFISLVKLEISFLDIGLNGKVGSSGTLYNFFTIGMVWLGLSAEKPISISFFGFNER